MMKRFARSVAGLLLAVSLASCGGGGGDAGCNTYEGCSGNPIEATVSELRMALSQTSVSNVTTTPVTVTVTAVGSNGQVIPGVTVSYSVTGNGLLTLDSSSTDSSGRNVAEIDLGDDKSNRSIVVTATAGGKSVFKYLAVVGSKIDVISAPTPVDPVTSSVVEFAVRDASDNPQPGVEINVSATGGLPTVSGFTDSDGLFPYPYTAPNSPGSSLVFTASAAGVVKQQGVTIKAPAQVVLDADLTGVSPSLQANPNVVAVNTAGSTANKIQLIANFEDVEGVPIQNVRVKFRLSQSGDTSVGGQFSNGSDVIAGTPIVLSGTDGKAQVFYIPGTRSSSNNAVIIQACYGANDAEANACTRILPQSITIADEAVSVTIGTDGLLVDEVANLRYAQYYVVQVANSAGQPKPNVEVSAQISTIDYRKGLYTRIDDKWEFASGSPFTCAKEDLDDDDRLDTAPVVEDIDHDNQLEPKRADVILTAVNGFRTNADGIVLFKMAYPKDKASWVSVNIIATALVGGSEGRANRSQVLAVPSSAINAEGDPPFRFSPYGVVTSTVTLSADRTTLDGTVQPSGTMLTPCRNFQ